MSKPNEYDDLFPISLYKGPESGIYYILDRHNDEIAQFSAFIEVEEMERVIERANQFQETTK